MLSRSHLPWSQWTFLLAATFLFACTNGDPDSLQKEIEVAIPSNQIMDLTIGHADVNLSSYTYGTETCGVTACYTITGSRKPSVSHYIVGTPSGCDENIALVTLNGNPVTNRPSDLSQRRCDSIHGIKFDKSLDDGETDEVCITYDKQFPLGEVEIQVKAGRLCETGLVAGPVCDGSEKCDDLDNDCDGEVDEDFNVGEQCENGQLGVCAREGTLVCSEDGTESVCNAPYVEPGTELCGSRVDEDCDGQTDEGFDVGNTCDNGQSGVCARDGEKVCSDDGLSTVCNAPYVEPGTELCGTDLDEDCDGVSDEGFDDGDLCNNGQLGVCTRDGVKVCTEDGLSTECNAPYVDPGQELCGSGLDEDCDGSTDEGFNNGESCSNDQLGVCARDGELVCTQDGLGTECNAPFVEAGQELCGTNLDEDCDGAVDEGFDVGTLCDNGQLGTCSRDGTKVCTESGLGTECSAPQVEAGTELCGTGLDEDCDGAVDEGFNEGDPCSAGIGACQGNGEFVCTLSGLTTECNAVPGEPVEELCNGVDDNCNGESDEGLGGSETELGGADPVQIASGEVTLVSYTLDPNANTTTVCYDITSLEPPEVSHFIEGTVETCDDALLLVTLDGQEAQLSPGDYSQGGCADIHGLKVDQGISTNEVRRLCLTYDGLRAQGVVQFQIKAGQLCETGNVYGATCEYTEICPAL